MLRLVPGLGLILVSLQCGLSVNCPLLREVARGDSRAALTGAIRSNYPPLTYTSPC